MLWGFYRNSKLEAKSVKQLLGLFFRFYWSRFLRSARPKLPTRSKRPNALLEMLPIPAALEFRAYKSKQQTWPRGFLRKQKRTGKDFFGILSLPIGTHDVRVMATGFREQVFEHQVLQIAQSLRVDAKLVIGEQSDVVATRSDSARDIHIQHQPQPLATCDRERKHVGTGGGGAGRAWHLGQRSAGAAGNSRRGLRRVRKRQASLRPKQGAEAWTRLMEN